MKAKKEKKSKAERIHEQLGEQTFRPSTLLKVGLIIAWIIAALESLFFLPYVWTIFWFKRFNKTYYGVTRESQKPLGYIALFFFGIIPGILILIDYYKNKKKETE